MNIIAGVCFVALGGIFAIIYFRMLRAHKVVLDEILWRVLGTAAMFFVGIALVDLYRLGEQTPIDGVGVMFGLCVCAANGWDLMRRAGWVAR